MPDPTVAGAGASPRWLRVLGEEDLQFVRRLVLSSGSLKALAAEYGVSYPTVRQRLNRLIAKVEAAEDPALANDPVRLKLQLLVAEGRIDAGAAREVLKSYEAARAKEWPPSDTDGAQMDHSPPEPTI